MNQRGQFFLIATFIVITLFLSLTLVYNNATSPVGDTNIESIASNLKFEGVQIINNGYNNKLTQTQIRDNLRDFTNITSTSFKIYNMTIITVSDDLLEKNAYNYVSGKETDFSSNIFPTDGAVSLNLNSLKFDFNLSKGYNFFVIVVNEKQNERYIISK